ncbi:MAG TPA: hypothetical protein VIK91_18675 [Nannocystis sp.]
MGPTSRDWLLLAVSAAFVAAGLLLILREPGRPVGFLGVLFFGLCLAVAVDNLVRKRRAARQWSDPTLTVHIVGGEDIPVDTRRIRAAGIGLLVVGAALALLGRDLGAMFVALSLVLALLGAGGLVALALGYTGRSALRFSPEALWIIAGRYRYPVRWDNIAAVDLAELHDQPFVRIHVRDRDAVLAAVDPPDAARAVTRAFAQNAALLGAEIAVFARLYRVDEVVLLRAIARYAADPQARAELAPGPELASPVSSDR